MSYRAHVALARASLLLAVAVPLCWPAATLSQQTASQDTAPASDSSGATAKIMAGDAARLAGHLDRALVAYTEALALSESASTHVLRGRAHAEHGDDRLAMSDFDKAIALEPQGAEAFAGRAWLHAARDEYEQAEADANEALRLDAKNLVALLARARAYQSTERADLAASDIKQIKEIDAAALDFQLPQGVHWADTGADAAKMIQRCDEALRSNPQDFAALVNRGYAHSFANEPQKASDDFTAALALNPSFARGYNLRGMTRIQLKEQGQALVDFSNAILTDSAYRIPYVNRAACWSALGHNDLAIADLTKVLEIDPQFKHALRHRMLLYVNERRFDAAITDADALLAIQPEQWAYSSWAYMYRVRCLMELNDFQSALRDLDEMIRRSPKDAQLYAARAFAYYKSGNLEQALADDARAREFDPRFGRDYRALSTADFEAKTNLGLPPPQLPAIGAAEKAIAQAIEEYRAVQVTEDFARRVVIDNRLAAGAGRVPVTYLESLFRDAPEDRDVGMAVAVCMRLGWPDDKPLTVTKMFVDLLDHPESTVRYRAARSIVRRCTDRNLSLDMASTLAPAVKIAAAAEQHPAVKPAMFQASQGLAQFLKENKKP